MGNADLEQVFDRWKGLGTAALVVVILLIFALSSSFYSVPADSEAVILRFGKYRATTGPGLHMKIPFGIDRRYEVPVKRVISMEFGFTTLKAGKVSEYRVTPENMKEKLMLSGDLNIASVEWVIQYRIDDPKEYLFVVNDVEGTMRDASEAVMRRLVGDRSVDEVITMGREQLAADTKVEAQRLLDEYECGVQLVTVTLQDATPPEPVKDAFDDVNRAQQEKDRVINQAMAFRNSKIPAARGEREKSIKEAGGYKKQKIRTVQGEVAALRAQHKAYLEAPEETKFRLFMETMESVFQKAGRKVIVDTDVKSVLPHLDLGGESKGDAR
jgi:membrane protease subunit HflK